MSMFTAVKTGLQKNHDICFSTNGINQMWILKNLKRFSADFKV